MNINPKLAASFNVYRVGQQIVPYDFKVSRKLGISIFVLVLALMLGWTRYSHAETFNDPAFTSEVVATLPPYSMVGLDWSPDGRLFVWQKNGVVRVIKNGVLLPTPFIDLSSQVNTFDDRGMWGLAFDPDFTNNRYVYLSYVYEEGGNPNNQGPKTSRLVRIEADPSNPDVALPNSELVILGTISTPPCSSYLPGSDCIPADGGSHTIGKIKFAPDGKILLGNGDGSNGDALSLGAQDLDSWRGKILRIKSNGTAPGDNPFDDGTESIRSKVWLYGVRNPFGFDLHPTNGHLYFGEVGWNTWEEMNRGVRGGNFGWPCYEGAAQQPYFQSNFQQCRDLLSNAVIPPIYSYNHSTGDTAIIGGPFYTSNRYPQLYQGSLFFADYSGYWIRRMVLDTNGNPISTQDFATNVQAPVALALGPDGLLYYLSFINGQVHRILYNGPKAVASATPTYGHSPLSVSFSSSGSTVPVGGAITYLWNFGDGTSSTAANPSHTYTVSPVTTFTAKLTVTDSNTNQSSSATLPITVGSVPPIPTIQAPVNGTGIVPDQVVSYAGSATDPEDGALGPSALKWTVLLHHNSHVHTVVVGSGIGGSFVAENHGSIGTFSYEIILTATDSSGLSSTASVNIPILPPQPDNQPPTAPVLQVPTVVGTSQINLSWNASTDNVGVSRYLVERCQGSGCNNFAQIGTPSGTSYSDVGLTANTSYSYRVRATDAAANFSEYSNIASTTTANIPPPAGMVAAYAFNEGLGTTITDVSGNGNTGTISGAAWTTQGKYGNALNFNGTSDLVAIPASASLNLTSAMTLAAWVKPSVSQSGWRTIMQWEGDAVFFSASSGLGALRPAGGGAVGGSYFFIRSPSEIAVNDWSYVALTFDGTTLRLYINGVQVDSGAPAGSFQQTNGKPLRIGGSSNGEYFQGLIDEVRVYNRALSAEEVETAMNTPMGGVPIPDTQAPTAPTLQAPIVSSATQINLSWSAATDNVGVTNYRVERCQGAGCSAFAQVATPSGTSYNDTGLTANTSYSYRVRAQDAANNLSAYSNVASATTLATSNQPPNFTSTAPTAATIGVPYSYTVAATDPDGNNPITYALVPGAFPAGMTMAGATVNWTPVSGQVGLQSFTVRATDSLGAFRDQINTVTVSTVPGNTAPSANDDTFLYRANVTRTVNYAGSLGQGVLGNDTDAENNSLTANLLAGSLTNGGILNLASNGSFTYIRSTGNNNVSFRYRAFDGSLLSLPETGATVFMRVDTPPTTRGDNCTYDRSANTVTQPARCTVTAARTVLMNVAANDIDQNTTTNIPTDGVGDEVIAGSMLVTLAGTGVDVTANPACGQNALGVAPGTRATIVNNCNGTLTVAMTASNTQNVQYSYTVKDDMAATSSARSVTLTSQQ